MTSKNSLFDMRFLRERMSRMTWLTALYSTFMFFAGPVYAVLRAQMLSRNLDMYKQSSDYLLYVSNGVNSMFENEGVFILVLIVMIAVVSAAIAFSYIGSKNQIDFFHSQPVSREKLFVTNYLAGILTFVIPYIIAMLLSVLVWVAFGFGEFIIAGTVLKCIGTTVLFYLVIYVIALAALMICGNTSVGLAGTAVLFILPPLTYGIIYSYKEVFYRTFYESAVDSDSVLRILSPIYDFISRASEGGLTAGRIVIYCIAVLVFTVLCALMYRYRRSEASGKAIAFTAAKPIIKYPIMAVAAAGFALMFQSIGGGLAWLVFGLLCGAVLSHCVIEIIYEFDFKAVRRNVKPAIACTLITALLVAIPVFDITGYDKRLPNADKVGSVSVMSSTFTNYDYFTTYRFPWNRNDSQSKQIERLSVSDPAAINAAFEIARTGISVNERNVSEYDRYTPADSMYTPVSSVGIMFNKTSGRKFCREYNTLPRDDVYGYLCTVYDSDGFKQRYYDLLWLYEQDDISNISAKDLSYSVFTADSGEISDPSKATAIAEAMCRDIMKLSSDYLADNVPLGTLGFRMSLGKDDVAYDDVYLSAPVYEKCSETAALLKECGVDMFASISADDVESIKIYDYSKKTDPYGDEPAAFDEDYAYYETRDPMGGRTVSITDKDQISAVLSACVPDSAVDSAVLYRGVTAPEMEVIVNIESPSAIYTRTLKFRDEVPGFVYSLFDK